MAGRARSAIPLLLLAASWAVAVEEISFGELDPKSPGQVVLFYRKGEAASDAAAAALAAAQQMVAERAGDRAAAVIFKQCDAAQNENKVGMEARGLTSSLPMLFVAVEGQGTDRYMRNMTADEIAEYIGVKLEATTEDDVFPFNEELLADEFPVLVKFHESWCSRCKHMKSAFEYAASKTVGRIMFMEVECSSTVETRKFCGKHHVDGFPTLKLMGGPMKEAVGYDGDRSALGILSFIQSHVPDALEPVE